MNLSDILKRIGKSTADNSPTILTAIGVTGTVLTAYLTGKASFKAAEIIAEHTKPIKEPGKPPREMTMSAREMVEFTWQLYIPAVGTGVLTVASIIAANRIGTRRAAAMAAAFSLSEKAFSEYKEKVIEKIGENKEQAVRDEIAQDHLDANPVKDREVIVTGMGKVLCYDAYTGRYFENDLQSLRAAMNDVNQQVLGCGYATLSDYYQRIGLDSTDISDEVGWNSDQLLDLHVSGGMTQDGRPCLHISFSVKPTRNFHQTY